MTLSLYATTELSTVRLLPPLSLAPLTRRRALHIASPRGKAAQTPFERSTRAQSHLLDADRSSRVQKYQDASPLRRRLVSTRAAPHTRRLRACLSPASDMTPATRTGEGGHGGTRLIHDAVGKSSIAVMTTAKEVREWRRDKMARGRTVGLVPTMGALHEGHLGLVRASMQENDHTIVSIFVNPAQFAPSEDFGSYPRTLPNDLAALESLLNDKPSSDGRDARAGSIDAVFAPTVAEMYPSPVAGEVFTQHVDKQRGAFVYVKGLEDEMEGKSRPGFFRGVATVVTKLFHVCQPDLAYFGQKDIQQAIILRRLASDLLFSYPCGSAGVRVMPTARDAHDGLALSSRNAYLTPAARARANVLYRALSRGRESWRSHASAPPERRIVETLKSARTLLEEEAEALETVGTSKAASSHGVRLRPLYVSLNDPLTLEDLEQQVEGARLENHAPGRPGAGGGEGANPSQTGAKPTLGSNGAILSGAAMIWQGEGGRETRLIDNLLLDFEL